MEKEYITLKHFKKYLTCQPFFIWHSIKNKKINFENENELNNNFWNFVIEEKDEITWGQINARTYSIIQKHLNDVLLKKYPDCIIIKGSKEERIEKTNKFINSDKLLINPLFEFNGAISSPFAFDTKDKRIIELKFSKKTKKSDIIQFKWHDEIIQKTTKVKKYSLFLPEDKYYKKGEISLININHIHKTKTAYLPLAMNGVGPLKVEKIKDLIKNEFYESIENIIENIESMKINKKIDENLLSKDFTSFGKNPEIQELLEKLNFPYKQFSGNVIPFKKTIEYYESGKNESILSNNLLKIYENISEAKLFNEEIDLINKIKKGKKIIWYDFEGFSLPISPITGFSPFAQVVFQVSVIETIDNIQKNKANNIVIDPLKICHDDFVKIIEAVYSKGANGYVVYNKAYEITRMKEMIEVLEREGHPHFKRVEKMLEEIKDKTIDLFEIFRITSPKKIPAILLHDQKCKSSIKNIEKHISLNNIDLPRKIKEYKNLEVQNGLMAMELAINRSIQIIGDNVWKEKIKKLKEYCENDVKAMIMVYDFIIYLMEK